jgi:hypothetical protein
MATMTGIDSIQCCAIHRRRPFGYTGRIAHSESKVIDSSDFGHGPALRFIISAKAISPGRVRG